MRDAIQKRKYIILLALCVPVAMVFGLGMSDSQSQDSKAAKKKPSKVKHRKGWAKGMTVSCYGWGAAWATPMMHYAMRELKGLGSNWISYHPYAWIRNDGSLRFSTSLRQSTVIKPLQYGKKLKLKMLLKPHIGYWGSRFSWRGEIRFQKESGWKRFFQSYTRWIVVQARIAQQYKADLFSVGVEYRKTLHRTQDWRKVIAAVKKVYKGKLTYSANWDAYQKVKFWDALDYIGIQAYFPLTKKKNPSEQVLTKAWDKVLKPIRAYSKKQKKPVLFTELGYNMASHAAARPWDHKEGGPHALAIKERCIKVALSRLPREKFLHGVFLWKWFPAPWNNRTNYTLQYPKMKRILKQIWR